MLNRFSDFISSWEARHSRAKGCVGLTGVFCVAICIVHASRPHGTRARATRIARLFMASWFHCAQHAQYLLWYDCASGTTISVLQEYTAAAVHLCYFHLTQHSMLVPQCMLKYPTQRASICRACCVKMVIKFRASRIKPFAYSSLDTYLHTRVHIHKCL